MAKTKVIKGVIAPTFTVFNEAREIDYGETGQHAEFLIEKGVDALLVLGTTQEAALLTEEENKKLVEMYIKKVDGRVPVGVGVGSPSTSISVERAKYAESIGADFVFAGEPAVWTSHDDLIEYHRTISESVDLPYSLYNNPKDGTEGLSVYEIAQMTEEGIVDLIKDTTRDVVRMMDLKRLCKEGTGVFYGEDYGAYLAMIAGADGWTPGLANVLPEESVKLWKLMQEKKYSEGLALWEKMTPLCEMITVGQAAYGLGGKCYWLQLYKEAAKYHNGTNAYMRRPAQELPEEDREVMLKEFKKLGY